MRIVHTKIVEACREVGLSRARLARKAGIPYATLRAMLYGNHLLSMERAQALLGVILSEARSRGAKIQLELGDIPYRAITEHRPQAAA